MALYQHSVPDTVLIYMLTILFQIKLTNILFVYKSVKVRICDQSL